MKHVLKIFVAALLIQAWASVAEAGSLDGKPYPDEWFACGRDDECVVHYECTDIAVNKAHVEELNKSFQGCNGTSIHNPNAVAQCVNEKCAIIGRREK